MLSNAVVPLPDFSKIGTSAEIREVRIEIIFKNEFRFGGHTVQEFYRIPAAMCVLIAVYTF